MIESWEDDDVISKLLEKEDGANFTNNCKSLHDELLEIDESGRGTGLPKTSNGYQYFHRQFIVNCFKNKKLNEIIKEFLQLNFRMDQELVRYSIKVTKDEKDCSQRRQQRGIQMLNEILTTQRKEISNNKTQYEKKILDLQKHYEKKLRSLEAEVQRQRDINTNLQHKLNGATVERDVEIENMITDNSDLRHEVLINESNCQQLAAENEELEDKVEIKDEYINSLQLHIKKLEEQHEQDLLKLQQNKDRLRMIKTTPNSNNSRLNIELNENHASTNTKEVKKNLGHLIAETSDYHTRDKKLFEQEPRTIACTRQHSRPEKLPSILKSLGWNCRPNLQLQSCIERTK